MSNIRKPGPTSGIKQLRPLWPTDLGMSSNPLAQQGAPVSFTANVPTLSQGQTQVLNTSGLANGFRTPYFIDEIRMQVYMKDIAALASVVQPSYMVQFQFRTGAYAFSNTPVPLALHAPFYGYAPGVLLAYAQQPVGDAFYSLYSEFSTGGGGGAADRYRLGDDARWLLPKPLWMAPGDQIQCNVSCLGNTQTVPDFAVDVTYVGRALPPGTPGPKTRYVPWIASYVHDYANLYSQTTTEFRNPFTYPLTVHKLVGRPMGKFDGTYSRTFPTAQFFMQQDSGTTVSNYAKIFIEDSLGYKVTRDYTAVANVFGLSGAWTFARPVGPREQLNMKFQTVTGSAWNLAHAQVNPLFGVAMHGYREETA